MPYRLIRCLLLGLCLGPMPAAAHGEAEGAMLARALEKGGTGEWNAAEALAEQTGARVAQDIVLWTRLRQGQGSWAEYQDFLARHPDWPSAATVRRRAEALMPANLPPVQAIGFFEEVAPQTGTGVLRLAEALAAQGCGAEAAAAVARGWREASFSAAEQEAMLMRYAAEVGPHHVARLDRLLWDGHTGEAMQMLPLAGADWQALARARIAVRRDTDGSTAAINAVPEALRGDSGLAFERYLYRIGKGRWEDAEAWLLARSTSAVALGDPDRWMERRANLARQALRRGDANDAYRIAAQSFGSTGADYADAEWLAGYIALTRLDDPELAAGHFRRFGSVVFTPISLGRAGFWLGLALEQAGDAEAAQQAYRFGADHQTSFYGQLAAERAGIAADPSLAARTSTPDWRSEAILGRTLVQAAHLLHLAGDDARASQFLRTAADGETAETRAVLAQMARDIGRPHIGIRIAKDAAADGILLPDQYYPLHAIADTRWGVPTEFALAIARQESEMNEAAISPVGARGLMQLMPGTAEQMARVTGLDYNLARLTRDGLYNARLGTEYLSRMLARYNGSYVLASAAYNAGPRRVDEWIRDYGDPRRGVNAVDWIETIPFTETRNYVMRVLEGLHVYRARLKGEAVPIRLASDIGGTG